MKKKSTIWVFLVGMFLTLLTIASISITLSSLRLEAIQTKIHIAKLNAQTFAENFTSLLQQTEQVIESFPMLSHQQVDQETLQPLFFQVLQGTLYIRSLSLLDEEGKIIASSEPKNIGIHISLNSFFPKPFKDTSVLRIGLPWAGRDFINSNESSTDNPIAFDEIYFLPILKKVYFDKKAYYIIASLNPIYLLNNYINILQPDIGSLKIFRSDAILLFSTDRKMRIGSSHYTSLHQEAKTEGSLFDYMQENEHELIQDIQDSPLLPFVVQVVLDEKQALGYWDRERNKVLWISTGLISLCAILGFILFIRYSRELKHQEEQLQYESQFRIAMEATETGLWKWNLQTDEILWDKQCYLLIGYEPYSFEPSFEKICSLTHPSESENMFEKIKEQITASGTFLIERRMRSANQKWVWIQVRGKVIKYTDDYEPLILTGVYINIDKQKKAEQLHLSAVAFEAQEAIVITDVNEKIIKVNETFTKITGYSEDEVLGKTPRVFASGEHEENFYKQMWESLQKDGYFKGEVWNKRKNGEMFAEFLTITAIRNEKGIISHYLANFHDITNDKLAQKHIKELAYYDPLTRVANRRLFEKSLLELLEKNENECYFSAVIFIDLDKFKELNDTYGHDAGDMLLIQVATRLLDATRASDTVARLGGDEFVILLENLGNTKDKKIASNIALSISKKILTLLNEPYSLSFGDYLLGASIGYTLFCPAQKKDIATILKEADKAMYISKKSGSNKISQYLDDAEEA